MTMQHLAILPCALAALLFSACAAGPVDEPPHPLAGKAIALPQPLQPGQVDLPRYPSISPDGKAICFSWRGDLWRVNAQGGQASRLTVHPGLDDYSVWSPDGKQIAFNSMRSGFRNAHRMNDDGTDVQQVTREDRFLFINGWADDNTLSLTGYLEADVHRSPRPYSVATTGGTITRLHEAFGGSPVVSPDGRHVAFVRGRSAWDRPFITNSNNRDLWLYNRDDKTFHRLTRNLGNDGKPRWLNNNSLIYLSARPPARANLYTFNINNGENNAAALTTFSDDDVQHFDISRDGKTAVLHVWDKLYTLDLTNPQAQPVALNITAPTDTDDLTLVKQLSGKTNVSALSPDGKVMAMSIHGELFVRTIDSKNPAQRITNTIALDYQPAWSPDGRELYFTSDRDGTLSIYRAKVALTRTEIKDAISNIKNVKEEDTNVNTIPDIELDIKPGDQEAKPIRGANTPDTVSGNHQKKDATEGDQDPNAPERWHDAVRFEIEPVVVTNAQDADPSPSPDGKTLSFRRENGQIVLLDLATNHERVFLDSWDSSAHWVWSHDSRHIAVSYQDQDHNADIWVGLVDGSKPLVNITKHPASDRLPSFSQDSKILTFVSSRNDDQYDVYTVYLDKELETFTPQQLADYYKQTTDQANKRLPLGAQPAPTEGQENNTVDDSGPKDAASDDETDEEEQDPQPLDLDDAYQRLRRLTNTRDNEWDAQVLPGGNRVAYTRGDDGYVVNWDGKNEKKIADNLDLQHLSLTGTQAVGIQSGHAVTVAIDGGETKKVDIEGTIRVNRVALQKQRFIECSRAITMNFYDGSYKGIDWSAATTKYAQLASRAWTADDFDDIANRYLGLLDASHMGIRSPKPSAPNSQPNGRLGASYERVADGYRVIEIEPKTPAAEGVMRLQVGDIITAIDFKPLIETDTVAFRLAGRVGQETAITVQREVDEKAKRAELFLLITPISYRAYDDIRYQNWQLANRAKVDELSKGRLGYIHIESMNESSLAEFERDLYAACEGKKGLIIDVRDNGGGWTTDRLLASIMTRRHAYTVPRGADANRTNSYPNSRLFIPRYNLPINAMCNENSFSNAEIFSHAFKTFERGTLVGNTTAGGVISTGSTRLLDGTSIRLPFRGWYLPDGTDMENNGAVPDLLITQSPEDESAGRDAQLESAVTDLLNRL